MIGESTFKHICQQCSTVAELPVPAPRIMAGAGITSLVWMQEVIPTCPMCGMGFSIALQDVKGIQALITFLPVEVKPKSPIITLSPSDVNKFKV